MARRRAVYLQPSVHSQPVPPSYWPRPLSNQTPSPYKYRLPSSQVIIHTYPPVKMEPKECSETSAFNIHTPGKYPEKIHHKLTVVETVNNIPHFLGKECSLPCSQQPALALSCATQIQSAASRPI
jgi:hypothetical protein